MNKFIFLSIPMPDNMPSDTVLIGFLILFILLFVLLIVCFVLAFCRLDKKTLAKLESNDFNIRVYTYDYIKKRFYSFDKINLTNIKTYSEEEFLAQFRRSDTYRIQEWFQAIIAEKNPGKRSLQVDIKINKGKKYSASILHFTSIKRDMQCIHFESQLLSYVSTTKNNFDITKMNSQKYLLKNEDDCKKFLASCDADILGSILYFEFFYTKKTPTESDLATIEKAKSGAINMINRYLSKSRRLCKLSSNEFLIIDTSSLSKLMTMNIASSIYTSLQQYLNFNSPDIDLSVAIGVTIGTLYQGNYVLGKEQAKKMADAICQGKAKNDRILIYDEAFFKNYEQAMIQKTEVKKLLENGTFRVYFSATYDVETGLQSFYMARCLPYGISIKDFDDVISYAEEINGGVDQLLENLYSKIIAVTKTRKEKVTVAIRVPYHALKKHYAFVKCHPSNINWIFSVKVLDLLTSTDDSNAIIRNLKNCNSENTEIGLIIDTLSSNPKPKILQIAHYFFVPNTFTTKASSHEESINNMRLIQSAYHTQFKTPIVFYNLDNIDDIETGIVNGGKIFECKEVSKMSSRLEAIDEDSIDFLKADAKKLAPKRILFDKPFNNINKEKIKNG